MKAFISKDEGKLVPHGMPVSQDAEQSKSHCILSKAKGSKNSQ